MPIRKVACSHCHAILKTAKELRPGKRVKCPQCGELFTVSSDAVQTSPSTSYPVAQPAAGAGGAKPSGPGPSLAGSLGESPPPSASAATNRGVLALIIAGALLFLGAGAGLAFFCFSGGKSSPPDNNLETSTGTQPLTPDKKKAETTAPTDGSDSLDTRRLESAPLTPLPEDERKKVDQAIEQGVAWLKKTAQPSGVWPSTRYRDAYAAFPGLTLLMCGVPANDPAVQRAAKYVRETSPSLRRTYELSLVILFLDRLGDPKDRELIQTLAMRLVAGQTSSGGWTYTCPRLSSQDEATLVTVLKEQRSQDSWADVASSVTGRDKLVGEPGEQPKVGDDSKLLLKRAAGADKLPAPLKNLPVLQEEKIRGALGNRRGESDNSNTQFALLALWAARRYDVPLDRTMVLVSMRFRTSQFADGGWGYQVSAPRPRPSMTCAGLLGLAVGHGVMSGVRDREGKALSAQKDPAVQRGLEYLAHDVEVPYGGFRRATAINLYYLWSLERVAVVYSLSKIGGKDWYRWGSQILVKKQDPDGHWYLHDYAGSDPLIDTCMALLFLKRANVVSDLTDKLQLFTDAGR